MIVVSQLRCEAAGGRVTLDLPHLVVRAGERVALVGPNGAGKSTLLRCLTGFALPVAGDVRVLGRQMVPMPSGAHVRQLRAEVAQVLQGLHLVQRLSALDNVLIGALGRLCGWRSWLRCHRPQDVAEALSALDAVGLRDRAGARTDRLSGGERQKVAIARMLMQRPRLILADEPTASLDPAAAHEVCTLLRAAAGTATLITVVHDASLLPRLADRVIGLRHGRLAFDRPLSQLGPDALPALYAAGNGPTPRHKETP